MTDSARKLSSWLPADGIAPEVRRISVSKHDRAYVPQCFLFGVTVWLRGRNVEGVLTADMDEDFITLRSGRVIQGPCQFDIGPAF